MSERLPAHISYPIYHQLLNTPLTPTQPATGVQGHAQGDGRESGRQGPAAADARDRVEGLIRDEARSGGTFCVRMCGGVLLGDGFMWFGRMWRLDVRRFFRQGTTHIHIPHMTTHSIDRKPIHSRRGLQVYQKYIVERFTAQTTNYQELLQVRAFNMYVCVYVCICV